MRLPFELVITTLPLDRLDETRPLQLQHYRHHAELTIPAGYVARDEEIAWRGWRARAQRLLRAGTAELFVDIESDAERDRLQGLALVRVVAAADATRIVLEATGDHAELVVLVVAEGVRGDGIGGRLYDAAVQWARDRGAVALQIGVRSVNVDALRFYERRGARPGFTELVHPL